MIALNPSPGRMVAGTAMPIILALERERERRVANVVAVEKCIMIL